VIIIIIKFQIIILILDLVRSAHLEVHFRWTRADPGRAGGGHAPPLRRLDLAPTFTNPESALAAVCMMCIYCLRKLSGVQCLLDIESPVLLSHESMIGLTTATLLAEVMQSDKLQRVLNAATRSLRGTWKFDRRRLSVFCE